MKIYLFNFILLMFFSSCTSSTKSRFQPEDFFTGNLLPLARYIYNDDAKAVKEYITKKGISVDTADEKHGYCLLLYAINAESKTTVKMLLEMGANPNELSATKVYENGSDDYNIYNRYPLSNATYKEDLYFAKILLKYGANPNLGNPLQVAIINTPKSSKYNMFDLLLENGANINGLDKEHYTPLFLSVYISRSDYANYFLDHGANVNIICRNGETAAYRLQKNINRLNGEFREDYIKKVQPTIDRFKARGVKFPVEKPNVPDSQKEAKPETSNNQPQKPVSALPNQDRKKTWSIFFDDDEEV